MQNVRKRLYRFAKNEESLAVLTSPGAKNCFAPLAQVVIPNWTIFPHVAAVAYPSAPQAPRN